MKKKIAMLFTMMLFVFAIAPTAKAAEVEESIGNALADTPLMNAGQFQSDDLEVKDINRYGSSDSLVKQIDATANSVTISWTCPNSQYAESYVIYVGESNSPYATVASNVTSCTISGLSAGQHYAVDVGFVNEGSLYYLDTKDNTWTYVRTAPKKLDSKAMNLTWDNNDKIKLEYYDESLYATSNYSAEKYLDGIEMEVKTVKGKKWKTKTAATQKTVYATSVEDLIDSFSFKAPSSLKNKGMQYRIRTYITLDNGKKVYSDWTSTKVFIPQAKVTKLTKMGTDKIKVSWKKVSGAKSYTVYKTTNSGKKYKKVKTVSANTTSYTVSGFKKGSKYGVAIVANKVKVGKKNYNSTKSYYTYRRN